MNIMFRSERSISNACLPEAMESCLRQSCKSREGIVEACTEEGPSAMLYVMKVITGVAPVVPPLFNGTEALIVSIHRSVHRGTRTPGQGGRRW